MDLDIISFMDALIFKLWWIMILYMIKNIFYHVNEKLMILKAIIACRYHNITKNGKIELIQ